MWSAFAPRKISSLVDVLDMQIQTLSYDATTGWSAPLDGSLDSARTLVLAFASPGFADHLEPFRDLARAFPRAHVLGCSTAGEIHATRVRDNTIAVAIARFEHTPLRTAVATLSRTNDSFDAGLRIARSLDAPDLRAVFVLSSGDAIGINGSDLVHGINEVLAGRATVTGGLAGDGARFQHTWVLADGVPTAGVVAAVGMYGDRVRIGHGSKGGWDIFGPERVVTRATGNVLFELDGRPALQLYKDYLGERAAGLPATGLLFPLAVRSSDESERRLVRTILAVDEATQSLTFAGDVPEGALAQLMRANFDRLIQGASDAALGCAGDGPALSLAISCVGRRLVLGELTEAETEAVADVLPAGTAQIGFYSYGEISPYTDGTCDLHNQTMTLTTLGETA
jgi:hypothetical protein